MTTDPRRPTTEAVNSRLLILPFCMDAIVHKHALTLRQLPGNIFDVGQSGSLVHIIVLPLVFYGRPIFGPHYPITPIASTRLRNASMSAKVSRKTKVAVPTAVFPVRATNTRQTRRDELGRPIMRE